MDVIQGNGGGQEEEVCIYVIQEDDMRDDAEDDVRFDVAPFRQTFFRYSIHGQSEIVRSNSFIYASHHKSTLAWLDIKKLSVALVGSSEIPRLTLFAPTVKEIYFMGHITYPTTAFRLLTQLNCLEKVAFNFGHGGYTNEFQETDEEFATATPQVAGVTSLELKINHNYYRNCTEGMRDAFNKIIKSVLKHSVDSFPNLREFSVDLPNTPDFLERAMNILERRNLRGYEIRTDLNWVQINKTPARNPETLPFDPHAHFPTLSQYNHLRRIDSHGLYF